MVSDAGRARCCLELRRPASESLQWRKPREGIRGPSGGLYGDTVFSDGIGGDFEEFRLAMNAYFGVIGRIGAFDLFGVPSYVPRPGHRRLRRTMTYFEGVIDDIIEARRRRLRLDGGEAPNDLLTLLLRTLDPSTGRQLSLAEVRSNIPDLPLRRPMKPPPMRWPGRSTCSRNRRGGGRACARKPNRSWTVRSTAWPIGSW